MVHATSAPPRSPSSPSQPAPRAAPSAPSLPLHPHTSLPPSPSTTPPASTTIERNPGAPTLPFEHACAEREGGDGAGFNGMGSVHSCERFHNRDRVAPHCSYDLFRSLQVLPRRSTRAAAHVPSESTSRYPTRPPSRPRRRRPSRTRRSCRCSRWRRSWAVFAHRRHAA